MKETVKRLYQLLLQLFPVGFREDFGHEMEAVFESEWEDGRKQGSGSRTLLRAGWAILRAAPGEHFDVLRQDVKTWWRSALRTPSSTLAAVATLALGIGTSSALFGVLLAVLWNPLPYPEDDSLVRIFASWGGSEQGSVSTPEYLDYRERASSFQELALYRESNGNLAGEEGRSVERVSILAATASLVRVLGVTPLLGRWYNQIEDAPGGASVAVIGHDLWSQRFAEDPNLLEKTLVIDGVLTRIIGVMPKGFYYPQADSQIWLPLRVDPLRPGNRGAHNRRVVARLKPGVSLDAARQEMFAVAEGFATEFPDNYPKLSRFNIVLIPLLEHAVGEASQVLWTLMGAVFLVLLVACANVANLLLAKGVLRRPEMALRAALGARPTRLLRQMLTESLILSSIATLLGAATAGGLIELLPWLNPGPVSRLDEARLDATVLIFAALLGLSTAFLAGWLPALHLIRLRGSGLGSTGRASEPRRRTRLILVVAEIALAVVLLWSSGLVVRSFGKLAEVQPGFESDDVLTAWISVEETSHSTDRQVASYFDRLLSSLSRLPGVETVGLTSLLPLSGDDEDFDFGIEGKAPPASGIDPNSEARIVGGAYFESLAIPLLRGRFFSPTDTLDAPRVVVVSRYLSEKYWGGLDALGKRVKLWGLDNPGPLWTIVGIVEDIRHLDLTGDPAPVLYYPQQQLPRRDMALVLRGPDGRTDDLAARLRQEVHQLDARQALFAIRPLSDYVAERVAPVRFSSLLLIGFAVVALLLTVIGIHGLLAFAVRRRRTEIGIRLAVGASQRNILGEVVGEGMLLVGIGCLFSISASIPLSQLLSHLLFEISIVDPITLLSLAGIVTLTGLGACLLPALRATRIDPVKALKS